ncbi:2-isopropylmalate synthase [Paenibacillus alvei]|uniref:2-isopropylmalate synthase n=1 Tax=Paenibacillus alvei TaxID=44250 RepID=UPI0018CCF137|nr:2-isopropylmalate synthase [Paenibacillus alvei]MBG9737729.1 2-isopropylmalate synthase [Paenibacillus alvei]MBG9747421.1 2-isopropylmalate synthase [Paenibacillus alvei]MCY9581058.1 2-isopropylmalate synthase [Paenibacillus alvei]MCY9585776.1 2-isopropylmalate synthase [Paenibacillus alvei]
MSMNNEKMIRIFDTTLRDGEQAPGAALTLEQKLELAGRLAALGVDVMEPGFPVSSSGEFEAVQRISRMFPEVEICGFARAVEGDIDAAVHATEDAEKRRIHLFLSASDIHLQYQLRKSRAEVKQMAREMVAYTKQFVERVEFTAMDATRADSDYVIELVETAIEEGATIINLPDTVGYALPEEYGALFRKVRQGARGADRVQFSAHCHNDLGLAVANSIAAIQAGATQIEVTVNGVGERTGNCALEELVMALNTRNDALRVGTQIRPEHLYETSRMVSRMMHFPIAFNKPIVGRNAFQHESGIHQDGLLKNRSTYEIMDPVQLGIPHHMIILGKHSGRHALKHKAAQYGVTLDASQLDDVYANFKRMADQQKVVTDEQLLHCIGETLNEQLDAVELLDVQVIAGSSRSRVASVVIKELETGLERTYAGVGSGPIEAVIRAIAQSFSELIEFEDLELHSLSSGGNAAGEAIVTVSCNDFRYQGSAMHQDIVMAAAQAYVAACNQAVRGQLSEQNSAVKAGAVEVS